MVLWFLASIWLGSVMGASYGSIAAPSINSCSRMPVPDGRCLFACACCAATVVGSTLHWLSRFAPPASPPAMEWSRASIERQRIIAPLAACRTAFIWRVAPSTWPAAPAFRIFRWRPCSARPDDDRVDRRGRSQPLRIPCAWIRNPAGKPRAWLLFQRSRRRAWSSPTIMEHSCWTWSKARAGRRGRSFAWQRFAQEKQPLRNQDRILRFGQQVRIIERVVQPAAFVP